MSTPTLEELLFIMPCGHQQRFAYSRGQGHAGCALCDALAADRLQGLPPTIPNLLANPESHDQGLDALAEWVMTTCLVAGTQLHTAVIVAGLFVDGIHRHWAGVFQRAEWRKHPRRGRRIIKNKE